MARRGHGEGSVYQRASTRQTKNGPVTSTLWVVTIEEARDPGTGRRRRVKFYGTTKAIALEKARDYRKLVDGGARPQPGLTVEKFLNDWLTVVLPARVSPETVSNYAAPIRKHMIPALGRHRLVDLTPEHVDGFLLAMAEAGFSRSYVSRMRNLLTDALNHAERRQLVARNVGRLAILPPLHPVEKGRSFTEQEADAFVTQAMSLHRNGQPRYRLAVMLVVMATLGVRPGEAPGLLWEDLDTEAETLAVSGSIKRRNRPEGHGYELRRGEVKKSSAGERTLQLPTGLIPLLAAHRRRQAAERLAAGPLWVDHGLMFPTAAGTPLDPRYVRQLVARVAKAAGIDGKVVAYTTRHSAASLRLDAGQSIAEVADLLGDDPITIFKHYRHRVRPVVAAAADTPLATTLDRLAPGG